MRLASLTLLGCFLAMGCRHGRTPASSAPVSIRPLDGAVGRVYRVNARLRFVVLDYALNQIPNLGTHLKLYHRGVEIGELRLNGPIRDGTAAADIVSGEPQVGDEARLE
jgi:hypothetical protein